MSTLDGIDTAHYQTLTGQALPPLEFATHKASEGGSYVDKTFQTFIRAYRNGGIKHVGAYHFIAPGQSAATQFANFAAQCKTVGACDIYQIDWEATIINGVDVFPDLATVLEFERLCREQWGSRVFVYSAPWVQGFGTWHARPDRSPLWLADYSLPSSKGSGGLVNAKNLGAVILQYGSNVILPAFTDRVDGNTITDWPAWRTLVGEHAPDVPTTNTTPIDPPNTSQEDDMSTAILVRAVDASRAEAIVILDTGKVIKADKFAPTGWGNLITGTKATTVDVSNGDEYDAIVG